MDIDILYLLSNRQRYNKYEKVVNKHRHIFTKEVNQIRRDLQEWWEQEAGDDVDWEKFSSWFQLVKHSSMSEDQHSLFNKLFTRINEYQPDNLVYEQVIDIMAEKATAEEIGAMCEDIAAGSTRYGMEDITTALQDYTSTTGEEESSLVVSDDMTELVGSALGEGLNWKQLWMNESLGPLRKGDLVMLAKRPDSGGTSFLAGQANAFAPQSTQPVLWFNNEQEGSKVKLRIVQEGVEKTNEELKQSPQAMKELYEKMVGPMSRIVVIDKPGLDYRDVNQLCAQYLPSAIIIDQLWKVQGKGDISDVRCQTEIANWARELAKTYAPVIGVYQLDGQAEGMDYPGMERIYGSKTSVQGESDLIICMGRVHEEGKRNSRFFHFPKNKMAGGGVYYKPEFKDYKREVQFNPETGVFK